MKKIKNKNAFKLAILTILANGLVACTTKPSNMLPSNKPEDKLKTGKGERSCEK